MIDVGPSGFLILNFWDYHAAGMAYLQNQWPRDFLQSIP